MTDQTNPSDACGCCEAIVAPTPSDVRNRPGLTEISYRVGTFATFRQAMIEAIAANTVQIEGEAEPRRPLRGWTARSSDDYGIAMLEMWAYLADILTFYQERIVNEAFLRSADFRESLLCLASMLDYKPAAGMAATAQLAFTVEADKQVNIPIGLLVQSVPGQDEKPQKFETIQQLAVESRLNRMRVHPQPIAYNPGAANNSVVTALTDVAHIAPTDNLVVWNEHGVSDPGDVHVEDKKVVELRAVDWRRELEFSPPIGSDFAIGAHWQKWRRKIRVFGHNAPSQFLTPIVASGRVTFESVSYVFTNSVRGTELDLDAVYDDLNNNTELLVVSAQSGVAKRVKVTSIKQIDAKITGTLASDDESIPFLQSSVTQVTVDQDLGSLDARYTVIYELQDPEVFAWGYEYDRSISPGEASVDIYLPLAAVGVDAQQSLERGREVLLIDATGAPFTATVDAAIVESFTTAVPAGVQSVATDHLHVTVSAAAPRTLDAGTAVLHANIVKSTHGETIDQEVLGSGDASVAFQAFKLKKLPVTFVPQAGAPGGAANTLQVRVGGVRWREVRSFHGQPSDARVYTTTIDNDAAMHVQFGDGQAGARLPTGNNNVIAIYRHGLGQDGNVVGGSIRTLLDRPIGLTAVTNLDDARGGAEPESMDKVRQNVPNTVRTFGRIVSLRDFEDAAREFAGIAKAKAFVDGIGVHQRVQLTVAGDSGADVLGPALTNLVADLNARRDPNRAMTVGNYTRLPIEIEVAIWVDPDYVAEQVQAKTVETLIAFMHFDNLDLGQPIHLSDVYKAAHDVEGVVAADANRFQFKNDDDRTNDDRMTLGVTEADVQPRLPIFVTELAVIEDPITDIIVTVEANQP